MVYKNVDRKAGEQAYSSIGLPPKRFLDGLTIGTNMYFVDDTPPIIPSVLVQGAVELLAHEAIHSIQAKAWGSKWPRAEDGLAHFIIFCANNAYKEIANKYELSAYKFGGAPPILNDFKTIRDNYTYSSGNQNNKNILQIFKDSLDQQQIPNTWWI